MTKSYINELLNEFDQEFESLIIPFPENNIYINKPVFETYELNEFEESDSIDSQLTENQSITYSEIDDNSSKLEKIIALATELSAERYSPSYSPEICLANLLNFILCKDQTQETEDSFFTLLNKERKVELTEALNDFDFYLNNPYKKRAEKILSKIEARKNR